ncbi:hypothetical protein GS508_21440 [Rhodococcus hoagii]|nr:hypothetical protein [Prescottella equi]
MPGQDQWTVGEVADRVGRGDDALAVLSGPGLVSAGPTPDAGGTAGCSAVPGSPVGEADGHGLQEFCVEVAARAVRERRVCRPRRRPTVQVSVHVVGVEEDRFVERIMTVEATVE